MKDITKNPEFLRLTMMAQEAFMKASHLECENGLKGRFTILDMLDFMDEEEKRNDSKTK